MTLDAPLTKYPIVKFRLLHLVEISQNHSIEAQGERKMVAQLTKTKTLTPEEYLAIEVESPDRHEYRNGEMTIIPGGKPNHNDIGGNFYIAIKTALRQQPYRVFYADQRLWLPDAQIYTYPDVMVLKKPIELQTGRSDTVMNAIAIAIADLYEGIEL